MRAIKLVLLVLAMALCGVTLAYKGSLTGSNAGMESISGSIKLPTPPRVNK